MTIKELQKILANAPDKDKNVYIPHHEIQSTDIGHNFDDENELDLYVIYKGTMSEEEKKGEN